MIRLLELIRVCAYLVDFGCFEEAEALLQTADQIAMGLELWHNPAYQAARKGLVKYIHYAGDHLGIYHDSF